MLSVIFPGGKFKDDFGQSFPGFCNTNFWFLTWKNQTLLLYPLSWQRVDLSELLLCFFLCKGQ